MRALAHRDPTGDRRIALLLALAALALYATTLCRTVYFYDSAELSAAAALLGIPHPPGYPLYTLLGHLYVLLLAGEPAFAVNVMSAVHGSACVALLFLFQRRLGANQLAAVVSCTLFATSASFWWNCNVAEVYTTGLVFVLGSFLLLLDGLALGRPSRVLWAAFVAGLGFAAHMFIATLGLGYLALVWFAARRQQSSLGDQLRALGKAALCTLAGASLYLYLPLRASMHPALSYGGVERLDRFLWLVTGGEYKHWFLRDFELSARALLVLQRIANQLTWPGLALGLFGLFVLARQRRELAVALGLAMAGNVWFFFAYRVHDLEVFFLPSVALLAASVGPALTFLCERAPHRAALSLLGVAFAATCLHAAMVYPTVNLSHDYSARVFGQRVTELLPEDSIVLDVSSPEEWRYKTVFEHYYQKTLGARPDVLALSVTSAASIAQALATGRPVFMYTRVPALAGVFEATPDGPMFRVRARGSLPP